MNLKEIEQLENQWDENKNPEIKTKLNSITRTEVSLEVWTAIRNLLSRIDLYENAPVREISKSPKETMFGTLVSFGEDGYDDASVYP